MSIKNKSELACLSSHAGVLFGSGIHRPRSGHVRQRVQRGVQAVGRDCRVHREVKQLARGKRRDAHAPEECINMRGVLREMAED